MLGATSLGEPAFAQAPSEDPTATTPEISSEVAPAVEAQGAANTVEEREPAQSRARANRNARPTRGARTQAKPAPAGDVPGRNVLSIEVEGNRKIEKDAILAKLKTQPGGEYRSENLREDLANLYKTGFFYDVQIYRREQGGGYALTYTVVERPSVVEIKFEGNADLKQEELTEAAALKPYEILNTQKIRDAAEKIQKLYEDKGYFLVRIETKTEDVVKGESVKVTFHIREGDKVKVKKITFLGNRQLKDGQLQSKMLVSEEGFFSFLSSSGAYKQDVFDASVAFIQRLYYDEGFVNAQIHRPQVYVSPNKKWIYITIRIDEGERFSVGEVDFAGDILFTREEMLSVMEIDKREVFSRSVLEKDISELEAKFGDLGYAFANVLPRTRIHEAERKVDITFEFDKGSKVYFGRINVIGNSATRDKVVRRELRVREGELYNETRKRASVDNIRRLGFFEDVNFKTSVLPERQDILNVDIVVKERTTGTLNIGAGYSSATGPHLQGQVSQMNFMGKGQSLGAKLNTSKDGSFYEFNFTEPYFMDTEWQAGVDIFQSQLNRLDWEEQVVGGAFRFGHPIGENLTASMRYGLQRSKLSPLYIEQTDINGNVQRRLLTDLTLFPLDQVTGNTSSLTGTLEFDQRNDRFSPSKGIYASSSLEYAGLGGDLKYTKSVSRFRYFKKLFWEVVWRNNLQYSFITSHDGSKDAPFNELFLLGGPYSLRGYGQARVGKTRDSVFYKNFLLNNQFPGALTDPAEAERRAKRPYGGRQQGLLQTELEFPLVAEAGIRGVFFYDVGQAEDTLHFADWYSDVGFGFRWFSPLGPLRFEWGFPLRKAENSPESTVFEFSIGSPF